MGCRRVRRIREGVVPRLESAGGIEPDIGENIFSGARNPRFGDETALFECLPFVVQEVEDVIEDFSWEDWIRHRVKAEIKFLLSFRFRILCVGWVSCSLVSSRRRKD